MTAQTGSDEWINIERNRAPYGGITALSADSLGNVYAAGIGQGAAFDTLSIGTSNTDFLGKFNATTGKCEWLKTIGSGQNIAGGRFVEALPSGDIFVTGSFSSLSSTVFGQTLTPTSFNPIFVARLHPDGSVVWVKLIPFTGLQYQNNAIRDFSIDAEGNSYVTFQSDINFCSECQAFVAKIKPSGDAAWIKQWKGTDLSFNKINIRSLAADARGNLVIVGDHIGTITAGDTVLGNRNAITSFVMRFDSSGRRLWQRFMPSKYGTYVIDHSTNGVGVSRDGRRLIITGEYSPDPTQSAYDRMDGLAPKDSFGYRTSYVAELEAATGRFRWVQPFAAPESQVRKIHFDDAGFCYFRCYSMAAWRYGQDALPAYGSGAPEVTGLVRLDSTGKVYPFISLGERIGIGDFAIRRNLIYACGSTSGTVFFKNAPRLIDGYPSSMVFKTPLLDAAKSFSIRIDSLKTSGICYDNPLTYKMTTSTFGAGNRFQIQFLSLKSHYYAAKAFAADSVSGLKLDSFSQRINPSYYDILYDTSAAMRICSTNPAVCSNAFRLRNPSPYIERVGNPIYPTVVCRNDTFKLSASGATAYQWAPSRYIVANATTATPSFVLDTSAEVSVKLTTSLGCTVQKNISLTIAAAFTDSLRDTLRIPCASTTDGVQLLGYLSPRTTPRSWSMIWEWSPSTDLNFVNYGVDRPFATPSVSRQYKLTLRDTVLKCTFRDSIFVQVDSCNTLSGKTNPNNTVSILKKIPNNPYLQLIKEKETDSSGVYRIRTDATGVYLRTSPNFNLEGRFTTYLDSTLTQDQAKFISLSRDTVRKDIFSFKSVAPYSPILIKGFVYDFDDPTLPLRNTTLLLVDSVSLRIMRGQSPNTGNLIISKAVTDQNGGFFFSVIQPNRTFYLMADRLDIKNSKAPRYRVASENLPNLIVYKKDSALINCSEAGAPCGTVRGVVFQNSPFSTPTCAVGINSSYQPIRQRIVKLAPLNLLTASDSAGNYLFRVPPGVYDVSTPLLPYRIDNCGDGTGLYRNIRVLNDSTTARDIGFTVNNSAIYDYSTALTALTAFRPGFQTAVQLLLRNNGTRDDYQTTATLSFPADKMSIVSVTSPANFFYDVLPNGILRFRYLSSLSIGEEQPINVTFRLNPSVPIRDSFALIGSVIPVERDTTLSNNADTLRVLVTGSFDPNDKQMSPSKNILPTTDRFDFQIRFQNTGTDTAFTVVVRDTLSAAWNAASLQTISASHRYRFTMKEKGIAEWAFENILLVDSFHNEPASHGFIRFTVEPAAPRPLSIGATLTNRAAIFFDYNTPVITNTAKGTVSLPVVSIRELSKATLLADVYPNPASDKLFIVLKNALLPNGHRLSIQLFNMLGQVVLNEDLNQQRTEWQLNTLSNGVYFLKISNGLHTQTIELVVVKK
jgi:Secretion system C-terminal sorting domain